MKKRIYKSKASKKKISKRKGLKKYTVPFSGYYFGGGRIYGQRVVFAENAEKARAKVQAPFDKRDDEPIMSAHKAEKWRKGEKSGSKIYSYWN